MTLPVVFTANGATGYNLTKSLRFRSSASAYLNRTPASAGNQQKWTWSGWVKIGKTENQTLFAARTASSGTYTIINIDTANNVLRFVDNTTASPTCETSAYYRDYAGWYHFVVAVDTTQATSSNRIKIYTNGVLQTLSVTNYPSQNANLNINSTATHLIGQQASGAYFDGYMAEVNFIDGQALTPSSFGSTNALTGVWQPAKYTGTYGTNGFYLPFTNTTSTSTLGNDFSGNSNTWTVNNISLTAGSTYDSMNDVPTLTSATAANYCVLNPLSKASASSITHGNLNGTTTTASEQGIYSTLGVFSGKWYFESIPSSITSGGCMIGIAPSTTQGDSGSPGLAVAAGYGYYTTGSKYHGSGASYGNTFTTSDVIGCAVDLDNGKIWWSKNGTWQASGDPAAGTNAAYTGVSGTFVAGVGNGGASSASTVSCNFGQQPFTYTPPTGFVALNTFNLPTSTIVKGNTVMDATLYTGDGTTSKSVVNAAPFKPDLVWVKSRSNAYSNQLFDSVRGTGALSSDGTSSEQAYGNFVSYNSNGFTVSITGSIGTNNSGSTFVGWQWQAGQGSTSSNTSGSITSTVSVNATAGFSIVTYTGTGANATVGHGLGVSPSMVIIKNRTASATAWNVYQSSIPSSNLLSLSSTVASFANTNRITAVSATTFSIGTDSDVNGSTNSHVAYCWSEIAGFSKFGSYTGNGSSDGSFIYTGFRPKFVMVKCSSDVTSWWIYDSSRNTYNAVDLGLLPNLTNADTSGYPLDFLSNGFKFRNSNGDFNGSGRTYIYMAFAENPFKNALAR